MKSDAREQVAQKHNTHTKLILSHLERPAYLFITTAAEEMVSLYYLEKIVTSTRLD